MGKQQLFPNSAYIRLVPETGGHPWIHYPEFSVSRTGCEDLKLHKLYNFLSKAGNRLKNVLWI